MVLKPVGEGWGLPKKGVKGSPGWERLNLELICPRAVEGHV